MGSGAHLTNSCAINHRASFLSVEYCRSHERLGSWLSLERSMMKSSTLFERGSLPPYAYLVSTRRQSHDRCSQAFSVFCSSSASVYYTEHKPKNKKNGEGLRTRLITHVINAPGLPPSFLHTVQKLNMGRMLMTSWWKCCSVHFVFLDNGTNLDKVLSTREKGVHKQLPRQ